MKTKTELKIKLFNRYIMVEYKYKENLFYLEKEILQDKLMAI